jgi:hypothetical protein
MNFKSRNEKHSAQLSHPSHDDSYRALADIFNVDLKRINIVRQYISLLFDPEDYVCFAFHSKDTRVYPSEYFFDALRGSAQFLAINALDGVNDRNPTEDYHHKDKPRRAIANVTKFRTFLIEFDNLPLDRQIEVLDKCGLQPTAIVFSGSKSLHALFCLEIPLESVEEYNAYSKALQKIFRGQCDTATKDAARLSRMPEVVRIETRKHQEIVRLHARIPNHIFLEWLDSNDCAPDLEEEFDIRYEMPAVPISSAIEDGHYRNYLMFGFSKGHRNNGIFNLSHRLFRGGLTYEACLAAITAGKGKLGDLTEAEIQRTVRSAFGGYRKKEDSGNL